MVVVAQTMSVAQPFAAVFSHTVPGLTQRSGWGEEAEVVLRVVLEELA